MKFPRLLMVPLLLTAGSAGAMDISRNGYIDFKAPGSAASGPGQEGGIWYEFEPADSRDWLTRFSEPGELLQRSTISIDQHFDNHTIRLGMADAPDQVFNQYGVAYKGAALTGFSGHGDTTSSVVHDFNHVDHFHFHGGISQRYAYSGYQLDFETGGGNSFGLTWASITSPGLAGRQVSGLGWRGSRASLSLMQVNHGGLRAGNAIAAGTRFGSFNINADYLRADNDATFASLSLSGPSQAGGDWRLRMERRRNPLFDQANEDRLTFEVSFAVGRVPRFNAEQPAEAEAEATEKNKGNGLLIGAGAIGVGVAVASGGGGGSDSRARFASQNEAAKDVLNDINPTSIRQNREWGGYVYRNADRSFSSTSPIQGDVASVSLPAPSSAAPPSSVTTASYHTHAGFDPRFDNENFSPQDLLSDILFNLDGYLATPRGQFKLHDVSSNKVITLGGPGTLAIAP